MTLEFRRTQLSKTYLFVQVKLLLLGPLLLQIFLTKGSKCNFHLFIFGYTIYTNHD